MDALNISYSHRRSRKPQEFLPLLQGLKAYKVMAPEPSPSLLHPLSLHLLSTVTTASADSLSDSDFDAPAGDETPPSPSPPSTAPSTRPSRPLPVREDCWSEEATATLIGAWGDRYVELNKGNLRRKDWKHVADAVNAVHGHTKKSRRTDIQCKNRIDTIKKKYKIEKVKTVDSDAYVSPWPFFSRLDSLIGDAIVKKLSTSTTDVIHRRKRAASPSPPRGMVLRSPIPVGRRSVKPNRPSAMDDSLLRRTLAAAAAAASVSEDEDVDSEGEDPETSRSNVAKSGRQMRARDSGGCDGGCRQMVEAIVKFGEIYERVEDKKQKQMIELEKQKMQFAKELEFERMKLLMEMQLQLAKIKRMKPSNNTDAAESF